MPTTPNENSNVSEDQIFEPFPKPQTMPSGWDLSGLTSDPEPAPATPVNETPEA